jgi:2,5-diamino-6-(ribosylamino)-4(3H)-pyrimidinone 5'-phosphate reductase
MGKVHVVLHTQVSVDSKADGFEYDMGTYYQLAETFKPDAVISGAGTMLKADVPEEVPEWAYAAAKNFPSCGRTIMTIVDSKGKVRNWGAIKKQPFWNSILALCSESTPKEYLDHLRSEKVDFIIAGQDHVDLRKALDEMRSRYGVRRVRIDSGGTLSGAMLKEGLVNEISLLISPFLLGNLSDNTFISAVDLDLKVPLDLKLKGVKKLDGGNIWVRYEVAGTK